MLAAKINTNRDNPHMQILKQMQNTLGRMEISLSSIDFAIAWINEYDTIEWCNGAFDRLLGLEHIQILNHKIHKLLPLEKDGRSISLADYPTTVTFVKEKSTLKREIFNLKNGKNQLTLEISAIYIPFSEFEKCVVLIVCDVTQKVQADRELAESQKKLMERTHQVSAINKELEAFSYSVSHDLRAPLRGINGLSKAVMEDYSNKLDPQGQDFLRRICNETQKMGRIIDDILSLSRITRKELIIEKVNLSDIVKKITERLKSEQPSRRVDITIKDNIFAKGDSGLLKIALENMLANSWKFTAKHSTAQIEFGTKEIDGKNVYFIRDDGAGFDMKYVDKVFHPFQRLHKQNEFPGTGIGLATVQRIVKKHNGRIWVQSKIEKETTFYFTLDVDHLKNQRDIYD